MSRPHATSTVLRVLVTLLPLGLALGCEEWPRYLYMDDGTEFEITERVVVVEDESLGADEVQELGELGPGTEITLFGFVHTCGKDENAPWPEWPLHDFDSDEDGVPDSQITYSSGWYTGDVDWIGLELTDDAGLEGEMTWVNSPAGDTNCADEDDPDCDWDVESDLDVVVFARSGPDLDIVNESGVGHTYPETVVSVSRYAEQTSLAIALACHHSQPTDYDLVLVLR
jgi:hypothetical protein